MSRIINVLKYGIAGVLCTVSMVLTACFALSLGSSGVAEGTIMAIVSPGILITIGIALDLSKYIFWGAKGLPINKAAAENNFLEADVIAHIRRQSVNSKSYALLAIVLMVFSWVASVAFFVSTEDRKLVDFRKKTSEYTAYSTELKGIDNAISINENLSKKRLESRFHEQWDKSEALIESTEKLRKKRLELLRLEPLIGMNEANSTMISMAFFRSIASAVGSNYRVVRNCFYGLLGLLIEVCAFGLISICSRDDHLPSPALPAGISNNEIMPRVPKEIEPATKARDSDEVIVQKIYRKAEALASEGNLIDIDNLEEKRIISDIRSGKVPPVFNQLKVLNYDISHARIKIILSDLKAAGVLTSGPRRSLVLTTPPHSSPASS